MMDNSNILFCLKMLMPTINGNIRDTKNGQGYKNWPHFFSAVPVISTQKWQ
jgi:hypothetical protein